MRRIESNVVTDLKWMPNNPDLFIQRSEDLTLRLWDIRARPFNLKFNTRWAPILHQLQISSQMTKAQIPFWSLGTEVLTMRERR
jgi:WD40 repeat protein